MENTDAKLTEVAAEQGTLGPGDKPEWICWAVVVIYTLALSLGAATSKPHFGIQLRQRNWLFLRFACAKSLGWRAFCWPRRAKATMSPHRSHGMGFLKEQKSLVLIIDDPDAPDPKAPQGVWVHWVIYNIPLDIKSLPENASKTELPKGTAIGLNDYKKPGYGGPCPPIGRHRYFHKLYALDGTLNLKEATKAELERAMKGHVLANAELIGTYQKGDR